MTCPTNPEHGRVYDLDSGRWFCPHKLHESDGTRGLFSEAEVMAGHVRPGVPQPKQRRVRRGR